MEFIRRVTGGGGRPSELWAIVRGGLGQKEMAMTGKNRIMIYGPKTDGTYIVEFRTADSSGKPSPESQLAPWGRFPSE
jgi:hypothetical protein